MNGHLKLRFHPFTKCDMENGFFCYHLDIVGPLVQYIPPRASYILNIYFLL